MIKASYSKLMDVNVVLWFAKDSQHIAEQLDYYFFFNTAL